MIHLYWHTHPSAAVQRAADRWRDVGCESVTVWSPEDLPELVEQVESSWADVPGIDHVRHVANVARWHILYTHGGVWADTDVWPLRRPNGYTNRAHPWCAGLGSVPTPFMCGGPAGHDLWARTLNAALDNPHGISPEASGGRLLQRIAEPAEMELIPAQFFAGHDAAGVPLPSPPGGRYSLHEWRTSITRYAAERNRVGGH
jgi:hypothetical protein